MKRKKPVPPVVYPEAKDTATQLREDAARYGLRRDVLGVREAKDQLSGLLQRAAGGEEIVITSDGVPTAMIVRYKPVIRGKPYKPNWAHLRSMPVTPDSTAGIRAERDSGP
jgi:prevent-host-death family protein